MYPRTILLTIVVVLSTVAAGTGGAVASHSPSGQPVQQVQPTSFRPDAVVNNSTHGEYRGFEPSRNETQKPVELETMPSNLTGGTSAAGGASASSSIVMDPNDSDSPLVGTTKYYLGSDVNGYYFKQFTLVALGDNVEVWVANDLGWPAGDPRADLTVTEAQAEALARQFDGNIYPTESKLFGRPAARNGSDALLSQLGLVPPDYYQTDNGTGRTVLLVDNVRDKNYYDPSYPLYVAGFYSPTIQQYTDRNVITIDAYGWSSVGGPTDRVGSEGTLAHEYQHLIHNDLDSDETNWINEGMSDFAEYATGYGVPKSHVQAYEQLPSNSLTNWEDQGAINVLSDYGEAFAFQLYLDDRFGTSFISNLAHDPANGITGVENTLRETHQQTDFYGLFQDFSTAVVTDDMSTPMNDVYHIDGIDLHVNTSGDVGTAGAWGTNYRTIDTADRGPITDVTVSGKNFTDTQWHTATDPVDGQGQVLYSGSGNLLDRFAITRANLTGVSDPTLRFETYYDIERNWDYGFVQVSTDGGQTWHSLSNADTDATPNPSAHPTVKANVPGFTGTTDRWRTETFDLSPYAGNDSVLVAFRYTTDWAVAHPGWYVRNVTVAGTSVPTDSVAPYLSLREARNDHLEYQFTFIGVKANGNYQVMQLDARTFSDSQEQELRQFLHDGNFERVIVASTWAAHQGEGGRVPVGVEFTFQDARDNRNSQQSG